MVFADDGSTHMSPAKQIEMGVEPENVKCNDDRVLMIRTSGNPICVNPSSVNVFTERGIAIVVEMTDTMTSEDEMTDTMTSEDEMTDTMTSEDEMTDTMTSEDEMTDTMTGEDEMTDTMTSEDEMTDTMTSEDEMTDTMTSEDEMTDTMTSEDEMTDTMTGEDEMTDTMTSSQMSNRIVSMTMFSDRFDKMIESANSSTSDIISQYEEDGDSVFQTITSGATTHQSGQVYSFVVNAETMEIVSHGMMPEMVGQIAMFDGDKKTSDEIMSELDSEGSTWLMYTKTDSNKGNMTKKAYLALHDGYIFGSAFYLDELESNMLKAKWTATVAAELYEEKGMDAFDEINSAAADFMPGERYAFASDIHTTLLVAHGASADRVGDSSAILHDANKSLEQILLETQQNSGTWVIYSFFNPETNTDQFKLSWLTLRDDYIFGSGFYPNEYLSNKINAMMSVDNALAIYSESGQDAFAQITALNVTEDWYPFVLNMDAVEIADGSILDRSMDVVWAPYELNAALVDVRETLESGQGAFISYVFLNPSTGEQQAKKTWIVMHDEYLFGAGFYLSGEWASKTSAVWSVNKAIEMYKLDGVDQTFEWITAMESTSESYPFVLDDDFVILAHGSNADLVGESSNDLVTYDKTPEQIHEELDQMSQTWVMYEFMNPATGEVQPKISLMKLYDGYIFVAGYYTDSVDE